MRLIVTGFGPPATAALERLVDDAKGGDPLAPVDVVVPSGVAGVTMRRQLADPGLVNVRFSSLPQLAERLAARHMALTGVTPLATAKRSLAARAALQGGSARLARAGRHPDTAALVEGVFTELDDAEPSSEALQRLAGTGALGAEVADLYRRYRDAVDGHAAYPQVLDAAVDAIAERDAPDTQVILFAPRRISGAERRLLESLAGTQRLRAVICLTRDADDETDRDAHALLASLTPLLGDAEHVDDRPDQETLLELAPDAEEEVRLALRRVVAFFDQHPVRPERVAIAYRSPVPYARILDEQLTAARLPHHVGPQRTLAESVAGHALLHLLDLRTSDYARAEVLDWLTDAPILDRDGDIVPTARWDRLSRDAGISHGARIWQDRLSRFAAAAATKRAEVTDDAENAEERRERYDRRINDCQALCDFVDEVVGTCTAVAEAATWAEVRDRLRSAVIRFLGTATDVDRWGRGTDATRWAGVEQGAYDAVLAAVDALAGLDTVDGTHPTYEQVRQAVAAELDRSLPTGTTLGRGVTVASLRDVAGADLDLLVVLGMTEDAFPPRLREHPILRDAERAVVGADLLTLADRRRAERRDYLAAVASARTVVLSSARADTRSQRALHPSPWFVEAVIRLHGEPVESKDLVALDTPWLSRHDSFEAALRTATTPATQFEYDVALALSGHGDVLAATDGRYARGREAAVARRDGSFGAWTGHVDPLAEPLLGRVDRQLSASSLQKWATCPLSFWLQHVLGVRDLEDPGEEDTIDAAVKGTLVHDVLEKFFRETLPADGSPGRDPDDAWTQREIARARQLLDEAADELAAAGRTGRPLLWHAQKARLHRQLTRILAVDSALRAQRRARPIALEDAFGRDGQPPLELALARSGTVPFAGYIDRVDRTDGGGLVVTDYKTGKGSGYDRIPQVGGRIPDDSDLVDRGRKLQLVLYALAARQRHGTPETAVESYYWFVEQGSLHRGAEIGTGAERRLLDVLDVSVSGIREGVYPARPGDETFFGWESCGFCPYDRVCPAARGELWERVREDAAVSGYAELAEPASGDEESGQ